MKLNVSERVKGLDGKELKERKAPEAGSEGLPAEVWITIAKLIVNALLALFEHKQVSGEEKFKRYNLANRVLKAEKEGGEMECSLEEANLIKQCAGEALPTFQAGKVWEFLEKPADEPEEKKAKKSK